jgi:UDP-glucose 4-epimerase
VKVLITGGAGFIGSHLADFFILNGDQVIILDNLTTGTKDNLRGPASKAKLMIGDIRNQELVEQLVNESDLVLHMAAALGVDNIMSNTIESISTNIYGSEVVLKAASKFKKRIVIASTSEIYGKNPNQPLSETDDRVLGTPQNFRWSYSDAKAIEEAVARVLYLEEGLPVTTIRFFNTVGPRQTGRYGMVIPRFVQAALESKPINIFGDGSQSRVFCHVYDATKATILLALDSKSIGEVFNIGGVGEISILDLASNIVQQLNSNSKITFTAYEDAYKVGYEDMQRRVPNISKISSFNGWKPNLSLNSIIKDVADSLTSKA